MKKKTYKIIICISLVVMLFANFSGVFGATNEYYTQYTQVSESALDAKIKDSILLDALANMINAIASLAEYLIGSVFFSLTGDNIFPWADRIIFNGIGFLDINFLNPASNSLFKSNGVDSILGQVVKQVYSTIFSLAVLFLGVAVGVMAIRLAISSIAAEKAKYKQAIVNWATCIVMLFLMHYILSFVFWVNEKMVTIASSILVQTIEDNNLTTTNFKEALDAVLDSESRVNNFIDSCFGVDNDDAKILKENHQIANSLITNESYVKNRITYVNDNGKAWYQNVASFFSNESGMGGDIGLPRLAYDVKDAKAISELSEEEKKKAKNRGYYQVNGHKIFITEEAYYNSDEFLRDASAAIWLSHNNSAGHLYRFYKAHPELKINDQASPNLWEAWATTIFWDWGFDTSVKWDADDGEFNSSYEDLYQSAKKVGNAAIKKDIESSSAKDENKNRFVSGVKYRLTADKYIIMAAEGGSAIEKGNPTDIIANLGAFFKQSAYVYTSEKQTTGTGDTKEVITGWRASKVSVTGALLYAIFIFQSCMYLIMYVKRLFYVIMLSMFGPIVVIYDFFMKSAN